MNDPRAPRISRSLCPSHPSSISPVTALSISPVVPKSGTYMQDLVWFGTTRTGWVKVLTAMDGIKSNATKCTESPKRSSSHPNQEEHTV